MMKCYHLKTFFLFTISINLCHLNLCFSEKNSSSNTKKVVKTWKTNFQHGFENWTVKKDSPWIIEKWDDVLVKHNHTHLRFHNGANPYTLHLGSLEIIPGCPPGFRPTLFYIKFYNEIDFCVKLINYGPLLLVLFSKNCFLQHKKLSKKLNILLIFLFLTVTKEVHCLKVTFLIMSPSEPLLYSTQLPIFR